MVTGVLSIPDKSALLCASQTCGLLFGHLNCDGVQSRVHSPVHEPEKKGKPHAIMLLRLYKAADNLIQLKRY